MTMITLSRELVQQVLEALEADNSKLWPSDKRTAAYFNLRSAMLQQPVEPVATLTAQRDALLEKIKAVIAAEQSEGSGCGGFIKRPPTREYQRRAIQAWQELHAAIKAVEEGK